MVFKIAVYVALSTFLFSSCDWFNPREAEKPWEQESEWQEPVNPSTVILNLVNAFENRNIVNYVSCLSATFVFYGDPADSQYVEPGIFNDWNMQVEKEVAVVIFNTFTNIELYFVDSLKDSTGTAATFYETYTLNLQSIDSTIIAKGLGVFQLTVDSTNLWSIVEWKDFRTDSSFIDWGIVKAKSR